MRTSKLEVPDVASKIVASLAAAIIQAFGTDSVRIIPRPLAPAPATAGGNWMVDNFARGGEVSGRKAD